MLYFGLIKDEYYLFNELERKRKTVRAIVINDKKEIGLIHIKGKDLFGDRDHYECCGGGIKEKETPLEALNREVKEEIGYTIINPKLIGQIDIQYNLFNRIDEGIFYVCEIDKFVGTSLEDYEKDLIKGIEWISLSTIDEFYQNFKVENVGKMIHERDYFMIKKAREFGYFD